MTDEDAINCLIATALAEDIRSGDITSEACICKEALTGGRLLLKQNGRVAGLPFLSKIFKSISPKIEVHCLIEEGSKHPAGTVIATIEGPAQGILSAERVALNLLQHMSGIATVTATYVEKVKGTNCDILDTRKTLPGLRYIEKYAVRMGGGVNHRYALDDRYIIKNNHLAFLAHKTDKPILEAVKRARAYKPQILVEVEVETLKMVEEAIESKADIIMLDNMTVPMMTQAVKMIKNRAYVEASGGVTLETVRAYAETGVNGVSIGALTHSVKALDISLQLNLPKTPAGSSSKYNTTTTHSLINSLTNSLKGEKNHVC